MPRANRPFLMTARLGLYRSRALSILFVLALAVTVARGKDDPNVSSRVDPQIKGGSVQKAGPVADPNLAVRVKDHISKQLWKGRITALPPDSGKGQKDDLEQLIERVKGVQLRPRLKGRVPAAAEGTLAAKDPNTPPPPPAASTKDDPGQADSAAQSSMTAVEGVDPNAVTHPFRMAEILYASGRTGQAAPFYERALAQLDGQDKKTAAQRQWILLQLGRCWREDQPVQARRMFSQLISEYPDSPWLDLARAWQGLTDWYLTEQPWRWVQQNPRATPRAGDGR